jgi:hypothetical protein
VAAIVDVWMQHPTLRFLEHDMFESLRPPDERRSS